LLTADFRFLLGDIDNSLMRARVRSIREGRGDL
jgi:hypothetical protein